MNTHALPLPTPEEMRRLALIQYLYNLGVEQSRGPEPVASFGILPIHDAIESMLALAAERHSVPESRDFMAYWSAFAAKGIPIPEERAIRRLTAARNSLKHKGLLPAHQELEGFRSAATNFMIDGCDLLFGIKFSEISLVRLIEDGSIKTLLEKSSTDFEGGDLVASLSSAAIAFEMIRERRHEKQNALFPQHGSHRLHRRARMSNIQRVNLRALGRELDDKIDATVESLKKGADDMSRVLSDAIDVVGSGLDLLEYEIFLASCPRVWRTADGNFHQGALQLAPSTQIVGRCLKFVMDAAIRFRV